MRVWLAGLSRASWRLGAGFLLFLCLLTASAEEVTLTILQTTDVHGHIGTAPDGKQGDWLRLASLIRAERQAAGGPERCLLLDSGDVMQGTPVAAQSRGSASALMLDTLGYDAWAPGNHDFDFGAARLAEVIATTKAPALAGNVAINAHAVPGYRVFTRAGVKVAVIGMTAWYLEQWLHGDQIKGVKVSKAADALATLLPEVQKQQPDAIVLIIHEGLGGRDDRGVSEIAEITQRFPQITLILGGHTHIGYGGKELQNTWYVQGDHFALVLARVHLKVDTLAHKVLDIDSSLLPLGDAKEDPAARTAVAKWLALAADNGTLPVGRLAQDITVKGTPGVDCRMSELLCRAIAARTGATVVLHGTLSRTVWPAAAPVTEDLLFGAIPYENGLVTAKLTPAALREIIAEQAKLRGNYYFSGLWGIKAEINDDGQVTQLTDAGGQPLPEDRPLLTAFNGFTAAGCGGRCPRLRELVRAPGAEFSMGTGTSREAVRAYLQKGLVDLSDQHPWYHFSKPLVKGRTTTAGGAAHTGGEAGAEGGGGEGGGGADAKE